MFNKVTEGGLPDKTLTVALAGTGGGKSRWMCSEAAFDLAAGRNVLYITLEMADWRIAQRIDANLLDVPINDLKNLSKLEYQKKIERINTVGRLIVKEYPTASASSLNFKHLINELKLKKNFKPDVVYVDYINICTSSRLSRNRTTSYEYIKAVAEELRGLGGEFEVPIITATQTNRSGYTSNDVGLEDTAESFGLPATADFMFALINTDELQDLDQQLVKQLKNRLGDPTINTRFVIGIDKAKMRYYDVDQSAQADLVDGPVMDNTDVGLTFDKEKFKGFF
jgi:replicative DNA helicase